MFNLYIDRVHKSEISFLKSTITHYKKMCDLNVGVRITAMNDQGTIRITSDDVQLIEDVRDCLIETWGFGDRIEYCIS
jgi:hypothetical protein